MADDQRAAKQKRKLDEEDKELYNVLIPNARGQRYARERAVRTWLIAYGIGALALLVANQEAFRLIIRSPCVRWIVGLFLVGVLLQVGYEIWFKCAYWGFFLELTERYQKGRKPRNDTKKRRCQRISALVVDIITVVLFGVATGLAVGVLVTRPEAASAAATQPAAP